MKSCWRNPSAEAAHYNLYYTILCHCVNVFGHAVLFSSFNASENTSETLLQPKVPIVAPSDEHSSNTRQIPIGMFSKSI